jgi:hypothetical protein|tara:strand:+ start:7346 stop:8200 length:855 start_codon:yes stop_codon:yes gene_type:complete
MRQVIISEEASAYTAGEGLLVLQVLDVNGQASVPGSAGAAIAGGQLRIARQGATASEAEKASPWMRPEDILNVEFIEHAAGSAEAHVITFSGSVTGETATVKIIMTTAGYEPFIRHNIEFVAGASAAASALAAAAAAVAANMQGVASVGAGASDGILTVTLDSGERASIAFDAGDSEILISDAVTRAEVESGTGAMLRALEIEEAGREDGNYDRFNVFAAEVATNVVAGTAYDMISVTFKNGAAGQIRGVDNIRTINIAVTEEVATESKVSGLLDAIKAFSNLA